jgi:hypothetical protein
VAAAATAILVYIITVMSRRDYRHFSGDRRGSSMCELVFATPTARNNTMLAIFKELYLKPCLFGVGL